MYSTWLLVLQSLAYKAPYGRILNKALALSECSVMLADSTSPSEDGSCVFLAVSLLSVAEFVPRPSWKG